MHIAIIPDGARRWAAKRKLPGPAGHRKGAQKVKEVVRWCKERGINVLTVYAFSTENWGREAEEISYLMQLFDEFLEKEIQELHKENIRLMVIGRKKDLAVSLQRKIEAAEDLTKDNEGMTIVVALSYGGRLEIVEAVKKIVRQGFTADIINASVIESRLWTFGLPDPDMIIRTSGEQRLSNFLIWQSAYSEFYVCPTFWPDFSEKDLDEALAEYAKRKRRNGK